MVGNGLGKDGGKRMGIYEDGWKGVGGRWLAVPISTFMRL
jgi:hypothetical protein